MRQQVAAGYSVKICQLAETGCRLALHFVVAMRQAAAVVAQDIGSGILLTSFQQLLDVGAHIARRHAGGFRRHEHAALPGLWNLCPEQAVQDVGMRFHEHAGLAQALLLKLQDFAQRIHLAAHALHHFVDRIHPHLAAFVSFERILDGQLLSGFHQQRRIVVGSTRRMCGDIFQQLLEARLHVVRRLIQLNGLGIGFGFTGFDNLPEIWSAGECPARPLRPGAEHRPARWLGPRVGPLLRSGRPPWLLPPRP